MAIAVIGLGVGYALSCALAETGLDVIGIDIDPKIVQNPRRDGSVEALFNKEGSTIKTHLRLNTNYDAISECEIIIVCVSTGDEKKLELGHVQDAVRQCLRVLEKTGRSATILVYSTLPFGSSKRIREMFQEEEVPLDEMISYCYMPLMIAQGTTANDFVNPPFIAFGSYSQQTAEKMRDFYLDFVKKSSLFNGRIPPNFTTTPEIAEMAKLVANAFLSTKISFANMVAQFCEANQLDGKKLLEIVGSDWRINKTMLKPGFAFGGACFPRDLESLIQAFRERDVESPILEATRDINTSRAEDPLRVIMREALGKTVLVLGKSYKAGVDDTRGSASLKLMDQLKSKRFRVHSYDPNSDKDYSLQMALERNAPEVLIVTTPEPVFKGVGKQVGETIPKAILDYAGIIDAGQIPAGTRLYKAGVGWIT